MMPWFTGGGDTIFIRINALGGDTFFRGGGGGGATNTDKKKSTLESSGKG